MAGLISLIPMTSQAVYQVAKATTKGAIRTVGSGIDFVTFVRRFYNSPNTVGSVFPSSRSLAEKIVRPILSIKTQGKKQSILRRLASFFLRRHSQEAGHRRFLEVGPGTGVFSELLIKGMKHTDWLDLVEFDAEFCNVLRDKLKDFHNVRVIHCSITDWNPECQYDGIVSGLPLNSFPKGLVEKCYEQFQKLLKPGAVLSYFEYPFLPTLKRTFLLSGKELAEFDQIQTIKQTFYNRQRGKKSEIAWACLPPARVRSSHYNPS